MNSLEFEEKFNHLLEQLQFLVSEHNKKINVDVSRELSESSKTLCFQLVEEYAQKIKMDYTGSFERQKTQLRETQYKDLFRAFLQKKGLTFTEAGSQQPIDFRIVNPEDNQIIGFELKSSTSKRIMCNDTFPESFVFYIILQSKTKKVTGCFGDLLLTKSVNISKQKMFERTINCMRNGIFRKNGNLHTYVRPNYQVDISHLNFF